MDIKKGKLNVCVAIAFKIITMIMSIVLKMVLIAICGNEVNGLNALYISIIGVLSVAELGVGSAITYCMYKPIVENDHAIVAALYHLFQKLYLLIGAIIFLAGVALTPFLPYFAKDYSQLDVNIYLTFLLVLISVTASYLFSAKISLINAYKNDYITTIITYSSVVFQYVLQITVLYATRSFVCYLLCRIAAVFVQGVATEWVARKNYGVILKIHSKLDTTTKKKVWKNVKAMFMHKIGNVLVNTVDSIVISAFVGVVSLGEFSNYTLILSSMTGIITLIFTSLTSVIGHFCEEENKQVVQKYCESFHLLNFVIGTFFFLGYYAVIDDLIAMLFSLELVVSKNISFVITLNGFIQFMRHGIMTFKDATGTFYADRWKPLFEGITNIILSICMVKIMGVVGVLVATIITNLLICHIVEPYALYKNVFGVIPTRYCAKNYGMIMAFGIMLIIESAVMMTKTSPFVEMVLNGMISILCSLVLCGMIFLLDKKNFKLLVNIAKKG